MTNTTKPRRFKKRPVVVEAVRFTGENFDELYEFCGTHMDSSGEFRISTFNPIGTYLLTSNVKDEAELWVAANGAWLGIEPGEWILKDSLGFYPCKPEVFCNTYEPEEE